MKDFLGKNRSLAAAVAASLFLVACGGSDGPTGTGGNGGFNDQTAQQTATAATSLSSSLAIDDNVNTSLSYAAALFSGATLSPLAVSRSPLEAARQMPRAFSAQRMAAFGPMASPQAAVLPAALLGKTFVFNPDSAAYVVDASATGAPSNGVRIIYYAVSPTTGDIVTPLNALGHVDLIDVSTATASTLRFLVVQDQGPTTLVDYTTSFTVTGDQTTGTESVTSAGFISNGTKKVDFDLSLNGSFSNGDYDDDIDMLVSSASDNVSLHLVGTEQSTGGVYSTDLTYTVKNGSNTMVMDMTGDDATVDGTVTYNGTQVAKFSGTDTSTTFTKPNGDALTAQEKAALGSVFGSMGIVIFFLFYALIPFLLLGGGM